MVINTLAHTSLNCNVLNVLIHKQSGYFVIIDIDNPHPNSPSECTVKNIYNLYSIQYESDVSILRAGFMERGHK